MTDMIDKINVKEILIYVLGMIVLGLGLSLSTKLNLGTSALVALPFAISHIYNLNFGNVMLANYILFIVIQIILHIIMKKNVNIINDISQMIIAFILTRFINVLNAIIPEFSKLDNIFGHVCFRIFLLLISIILIGVGSALALKTKYPPNPSNGLIKTIANFSKKDVGTIKNMVDITSVLITGIFSYIVCEKTIGIGIGTILAMLLVGRVMYYFNTTIGKRIDAI